MHQIWTQPNQWFVWKCMETALKIKGQETVGIQQSMTKLIMPWEAPNEFAHQILAQPNQQLVCKCKETARLIRGQDMVGI